MTMHWFAVSLFFDVALGSEFACGVKPGSCSKRQSPRHESLLQVRANHSVRTSGTLDDVDMKIVPDGIASQIVPDGPCLQCDFTDLTEKVLGLRFYMQASGKTCEETADKDASDSVLNQKSIETVDGPLQYCRDWLWAVDDGDSDTYMQHRLTCHHTVVDSPEEADLCYPQCGGGLLLTSKSGPMSRLERKRDKGWGSPCFEVPSQKRANWSNCANICLRNELFDEEPETDGPDAFGNCVVEVPYVTGISWPSPDKNSNVFKAPWMLGFERTTMLAFVGAEDRGSVGGQGENWEGAVKRKTIIQAMEHKAKKIEETSPNMVFTARLLTGTELQWDWNQTGPSERFWLDAWDLYASANFSWQPHGDTATRRALYDAVLFGSLPVVDTKAFNAYRRLFNGKLWRGTRVEDVFVVIPEGKEKDGEFIIQMLADMPPEEVDLRRSRLKQLAPALQWSANTPGGADAFLMALGVFRS